MGKHDRVIRIVLGSASLIASYMLHQLVIPVRIFLVVWGAVFLVTSSVGY